MYFIDREKITKTLSYMETIYEQFHKLTNQDGLIEKLAMERVATVIIESIIDVGNSMIDGFIMRDPGGYDDIIDILEDEKVIAKENAEPLKEVIYLRKQLVQQFVSVNHAEVYHVLTKHQHALTEFPSEVRRYLTEELGPVSAFLPQNEETKK